jgi:hypothetical protein
MSLKIRSAWTIAAFVVLAASGCLPGFPTESDAGPDGTVGASDAGGGDSRGTMSDAASDRSKTGEDAPSPDGSLSRTDATADAGDASSDGPALLA